MELSFTSINPATLLVSTTLFLLLIYLVRSNNGQKRPPGPRGWPVFGNMFELGELPHQNMYKLRTKYGPVLWLQLGSVNTMVVQSAAAAAELFKKHDVPFADRKVPDALTVFDFSAKSLGMSTYGGHWRVLRRLCSMEFTVNKRINETTELRGRMMDNLVTWIEEESKTSKKSSGSGEVQVNRCLFLMAFNLVGNLMLSRDLIDSNDPEAVQFFESMKKVLELAGTPNIADFLPILKWLDPLKIKKMMTNDMSRTLKISSRFVQERLKQRETGNDSNKKDLLQTLLEYRGDGKDGPDSISENNANIVILEMFFAGSESTSITIEWGLTELLRNPSILSKVREEMDRVVGRNKRVKESDIENLPYFQAVIKETLRLHPALPLLLPRNTMEDTNYMGYLIPKDTQVFVNAWAIGRDPDCWKDPLVFNPERFLDSSVDFKGQHFELIPFGSGRRICIGFPMAQRVVHLALATLVHTFDWEFPSGVTIKNLDMEERLGLTLRRKNPIKVIPKRRLHVK